MHLIAMPFICLPSSAFGQNLLDANLDGKVDGTDYARIDSGYLSQMTGWFNGDFNYDGTVNGSDYTLIDNAFYRQGARLNAQVARVRDQ